VPGAEPALGDVILTAIMTHLAPEGVRAQLDYLNKLAPDSRFVVCHSGKRADFDRLDVPGALFIDDPSMRGRDQDHSHNAIFTAVWERHAREDPAVELVYFIEYDHLILRADFEDRLGALSESSAAGLFAKHAGPRNDTNWPHYARFRHDERFNRFVTEISRRDDPDRRLGALGNGMLFRREALEAYCALGDMPHAYVELVVPTVVYHLGFDVVNVDAVSDLYAAVRWRPNYTVDEAIAAKAAGRTFVHPFKELDRLERIREASAGEVEHR
jgi:hypothetical protein